MELFEVDSEMRLQNLYTTYQARFLIQCLYSSQSRAWSSRQLGDLKQRECCRSQSCDGIYRQVHTSLCLTSSHAWQLYILYGNINSSSIIKINRAQFSSWCVSWMCTNMHLECIRCLEVTFILKIDALSMMMDSQE